MNYLMNLFRTNQKGELRKNTVGEFINSKVGEPITFTYKPKGWDADDMKAFAEWKRKFRFGQNHSRFVVGGTIHESEILNRTKLRLVNEM